MSCNCKGADLRKKYSGMFFSGIGSSKPEKEIEKKLKKQNKKKDENNG